MNSALKTALASLTKESDLLGLFLHFVEARGLSLYPAQEEALLALFAGEHVILNTPTGSGKSLVGEALAWKALAERTLGGAGNTAHRLYYTAPIKALVAEKFFAFCEIFGAENVGLMTGDASVNRDAPIVCCTAEILANFALSEGQFANISAVVVDEFHYYSDRERGVAWQVPLIWLKRTQFLLMSATLGDTDFFRDDLQAKTQRAVSVIKSAVRPVPLSFEYREIPIHETLREVFERNLAPVYVVHFTQRSAVAFAQEMLSHDFSKREQRDKIKSAIATTKFDSPFGNELKRVLLGGIGVHHAGLLPRYRLLVEKLAQEGLLPIVSGTDTLGVGINVPIRSVLFSQLCKFDGERTSVLKIRDFHQIAGRAGRKGFDNEGAVFVLAPEHVIENRTSKLKAAGDPKKLKKLVLRKPPEEGFAPWDESTMQRLVASDPERLVSRFQITASMILQLASAPRSRTLAQTVRSLIDSSHESRKQKLSLKRHALRLGRALLAQDILEIEIRDGIRDHRLASDLQLEFSLNQPLSLFLVRVLSKLDPQSPSYAEDVLSVIEAIVENPEAILRAQFNQLKQESIAAWKAEGIPFEERQERLEKLSLPRPMGEWLDPEFHAFQAHHPWVQERDYNPKSIVRAMFEASHSFSGFVRELGLERSEGVLLRYMMDVYRTLMTNVPDANKTPELEDAIDWLAYEIKRTDTSLIDEWARLQSDAPQAPRAASTESSRAELQATEIRERERVAGIRSEVFQCTLALLRRQFSHAELLLGAQKRPELEALAAAMYERHAEYLYTADARQRRLFACVKETDGYRIRQTLLDSDGDLDTVLVFVSDGETLRCVAVETSDTAQ